MALLSTNSRLVKVGSDYSAGSGISIDDHVISVTGEFGKTYSAGENIDIYQQDEQLYISSKDWSDDIANASANAYNAATAQIPDPFDPSFISGQIDNKLDSTAFTNWQNSQYATDLQTIEGQIANKLDESAFSSVSASFLTAINIPESATWNEVSQAYEQASGTYLTSISIPESATWQDVSTTVQTNSATWGQGGTGGDEEVNSFVYNNSANILDVDTSYKTNSGLFLTAAPADMATTGDVADLAQSVSETYQVKGDYLTTADSANFYPANNPDGFITGVDLSDYYTKDETSGKEELSDAFANVPTPDYEVESYIHNNSASIDESKSVVQSNSSTWADVTAYQSNSGNYITAHQSLEGYATEQWVGEQGYLTEVSIPESANWNEATTTVQTNSSNWDNVTNKLDTTSFSDVSSTFLTAVDLSPYATETLVEETSGAITSLIPTDYYPDNNPSSFATENWVTGQGYITGVDLSNYYTKSETSGADELANAFANIPAGDAEVNTYVQTNSGTIDDTVTSYQTNSSTYMVEPNLEYNAVGEISGYGNSAIAQYGAEKQWLQHDDTLVHAANSAQYALGVNLSAVAQLLGVDETLLWSGNNFITSGTTAYLSDNISNYKEVKVCYNPVYTKSDEFFFEVPASSNSYRFSVLSQDTNLYQTIVSLQINGTEFYIQRARGILFNTTNSTWSVRTVSPTGSFAEGIYKIVGIGRKS